MAALRINILSNYGGQIWMAVVAIAFLPQYIRILGMEAFGLVGLMLSLQSISKLFDIGIGGAVNRELSRRAHNHALTDSARDLVRTAECAIWLLAAMVALVIWSASSLMAESWLHLQFISSSEGAHAISTMGLAIALLWPSAFYDHCLSGLEQQPVLNALNALFATLRYAGALAVLLWVSPTLEAFFWWFVAVGAGQSLVTAIAVWRALPQGHRAAHWSSHELRSSRRFAGGLFTIGLLTMGISQIDRLSLATLRPLAELGYYTLALSVAAGLGRMVLPMFNALYPRFSRLIVTGDEKALRELYHLSNQCVAVVVAAVALVLIVFARDVVFLWTGSAEIASKVALPLAILVAGSALNGLMNIPYALQLASGWTRLTLGLNAASLLLGIPFCLWAVSQHGLVGATFLWLLANLASLAIGMPLMHRRLLRSELARWYLHDIFPPVLAASVAAAIMNWLLPPMSRSIFGVALLGFASVTTLIASALASREVRALARGWLSMHALFRTDKVD